MYLLYGNKQKCFVIPVPYDMNRYLGTVCDCSTRFYFCDISVVHNVLSDLGALLGTHDEISWCDGTVLSDLGACSGNMDWGPTIFLVSSMRATISATASSRVSSSTRRFLLVSLLPAPSSSEPSWDRFFPPGRPQNKVSDQELFVCNQCCGSESETFSRIRNLDTDPEKIIPDPGNSASEINLK